MSRKKAHSRKTPKARPRGLIELSVRGFGFVKTAEGEFFIPASQTRGAFPGDLVEVASTGSRDGSWYGSKKKKRRGGTHYESLSKSVSSQRREGRVVNIVMRARTTIVGRFEKADPFGVVVPSDACIHHDIFTLLKDAPHVCDGDVVEVEILEFPTRKSAATGRVVRVLGHDGDAALDIEVLIAQHKIETTFNDQALVEADACTQNLEKAWALGYEDVRDRLVFTIDPVDAKDFDDALSIEKTPEGYRLGVYIADVSRYVPFGSALDLDARRRATSVYLVDRVIPMLPERLSNDLCSLKPGVAREVLALDITLNNEAQVKGFRLFPAVINSKARLSYEQAQALIMQSDAAWASKAFAGTRLPTEAKEIPEELHLPLREAVEHLQTLSQKLFLNRLSAGCMDFDRVEVKVQLNHEGQPCDIVYRRRTEATRAVEEAMILANRLVAEWLTVKEQACVFRIHETPDAQRLTELFAILQEFGEFKVIDAVQFRAGNPHALQQVLEIAHELPSGELVDMLLLRSMKRARYSAESCAHFGLALKQYCHFTSPIRRYPDLLVHRLVKEVLFGRNETSTAQKHALPWMAEHASKMERIAAKLEHDSNMLKLVEYLQSKCGQEFEAVVSGVATFGLTLRLENTAQGFLDVRELGDEYFLYDPLRFTLTGSETGKVFRLGQRMRVVLAQALVHEQRLVFKLSK